jgi:hypothetical protein
MEKWYKVLSPVDSQDRPYSSVVYLQNVVGLDEGCEILKEYKDKEEMLDDLKR